MADKAKLIARSQSVQLRDLPDSFPVEIRELEDYASLYEFLLSKSVDGMEQQTLYDWQQAAYDYLKTLGD